MLANMFCRRATAGKVATIVSLTIVAVSIFMMLRSVKSHI